RRISDGAAGVRSAGEALTNRIKDFEAWLGKLPGRVETHCSIESGEDEWDTYLSFEREGKEWSLYTYRFNESFESISDRKLLRDASINEKTSMIKHFPDLLKSMVTAQKSMVDRAKESVSTFDAFAKSIGLKGGK